MRGKSVSMDGIPDFTPSTFYVPGERHENLPAGGFAGSDPSDPSYPSYPSYPTMGTPVQTLIPDRRAPEYATGGSGMFQGADFGHGKLIALHGPRRRRAMGQDDDSSDDSGSSWMDVLSQGLSTVSDVAQAVGPSQAQASSLPAQQAAAQYVAARSAAAPSSGIMSKKVAGVPVVALLALGGVAAFFVLKKKKRA